MITTETSDLFTFQMEVIVKVAQVCPTLCNPMDFTVHGILQARILEWVSFLSSRGSSQPGIKPRSPALQADSLPAETQGKLYSFEIPGTISASFIQIQPIYEAITSDL